MIKGLTHDAETGVLNSSVKYKGKISTGWQPNEGPNKSNSPKASGFFRFLKQVNKTQTLNGANVSVQAWMLNEAVQAKLKEANNGSDTPRRIECMCFDRYPQEMWESYLGKFTTDGLICKSYGKDSAPTEVYYEGDKRLHRPRLFDGKAVCPYKDCPDYKKGLCKEIGVLKAFPLVDLNINPYQLTTRSLNTINSIECAFEKMFQASALAHELSIQMGAPKTKFRGLMGVRFTLVHRKIRSGGHDVFVTQIEYSEDFSSYAMNTIRKGIENKQRLLENGQGELIDVVAVEDGTDDESESPDVPALMSPEDEKTVVSDFKGDTSLDDAAKTLIKS